MSLKKAYLYLVSTISIVIMVIAGIMLINLALKKWVFKEADRYANYPCINQPVGPEGKPSAVCDEQAIEAQRKVDEQNRRTQRQQEASQALAMILVATPVWWYHWKTARLEK